MKRYHIVLDPKAEPVVPSPRAVPVHLHKMFKDELEQMGKTWCHIPCERIDQSNRVGQDNKC